MKKKTIIMALFAIVAVTGQGQVKSGLDLCLRDETTGEWLIGLFDEFAVYDCEYWEYTDIQKDKLLLTCDGRRMDVRLKRKGQSVTKVFIDGVKHQTSVLTSTCLPDYPSKDETAWTGGIYAREDTLTLRVFVHSARTGTAYVSFINNLFKNKQIENLTKADVQGRFED